MLFLYVEFLAIILQKNLTFNSSKSGNLCYLFVFFFFYHSLQTSYITISQYLIKKEGEPVKSKASS